MVEFQLTSDTKAKSEIKRQLLMIKCFTTTKGKYIHYNIQSILTQSSKYVVGLTKIINIKEKKDGNINDYSIII